MSSDSEPKTETETVELVPIGVVHSPRTEKRDDNWGDVVAKIELDGSRFDADALVGLSEFSHAEVMFVMHRVRPKNVETGARHPRNNEDWPRVGIFAQRAKGRPNRLGLSRCEILDVTDRTVTVRGLDAIDGTPVLGIKPYMREFGPRGEVSQPAWVSELMDRYYDYDDE